MFDFQFFATRGDLAPGWEAVKNMIDFKFVYDGYRDNPDWPIYYNLFDIPELGMAKYGSVGSRYGYIVMPTNEPVKMIKHKTSESTYNIYNFLTEFYYSVSFWPDHKSFAFFELGGFWMEQDVQNIIGSNLFFGIGDVSSENEFLGQYKLFGKALTKGFKTVKIKQFGQWKVGPQAYEKFQSGTRLIAYKADLRFKNNFGAADPTIYK